MKNNFISMFGLALLASSASVMALPGSAGPGFKVVGGPSTDVPIAGAGSNEITTDQRWTRDNVYLLVRPIFVTNGAKLTIEPGTIVRGTTVTQGGTAQQPGTLIISSGSKLIANATPDDPIIMTGIDDTNVPGGAAAIPPQFNNSVDVTKTSGVDYATAGGGNYSPTGVTGNNGYGQDQKWGGVVMLGDAYIADHTPLGGLVAYNTGVVSGNYTIADANADGLPDYTAQPDAAHTGPFNPTTHTADPSTGGIGRDFIEGITPSVPDFATLALYGGTNDSNNAGTVRWVSIRYSGFVIGANNELNGLTMGGLGQNTVIEQVESMFGYDDSFEWFGGKFNTRFLFAGYNRDDMFDGDEGHRGSHQFWFGIQGDSYTHLRLGYAPNNTINGRPIYIGNEGNSDKVFEWDGGEPDNDENIPRTVMNAYNWTVLSNSTLDTSNGNAQGGGMRSRRQAQATFNNGVFQGVEASLNGSTSSLITPALLWQNQNTNTTGVNSGGVTRTNTTASGTNIHWLATAVSTGTGGTNPTNLSGVELTGAVPMIEANFNALGNVHEAVSQVVGAGQYIFHGLDPRLAAGVGAVTSTGPTPPTGLIPVTYAGCMRDNTWLNGWSVLGERYLQNLVVGNIARPAVTVTGTTNPIINFTAAAGVGGRDAIYIVERSTDKRVWTPAITVQGPAGAVAATDTGATFTAGTPIYYRVYAL